jgi:hypothetical protein
VLWIRIRKDPKLSDTDAEPDPQGSKTFWYRCRTRSAWLETFVDLASAVHFLASAMRHSASQCSSAMRHSTKKLPSAMRHSANKLVKSLCVCPALCGIALDTSSAMWHSANKFQCYARIALNNCPALCNIALIKYPALCDIALMNCPALCDIALINYPALCDIAQSDFRRRI